MGRKKNPGFYLYPDDITSSERCRALTREAAGVYFFLLMRMSKPPMPGSYRLSDWVPRPNWSRSDVQKCLRTADKYERLPYFAKWLAKNDLPWDKAELLPAFQELYKRRIIIVEGDMLIQPRMFRDNGFELPDVDNDGEPTDTILDDAISGPMVVTDYAPTIRRRQKNNMQNNGTDNGTENGTIKGTINGTKNSRVRTGDAPALSKRVGVGDNIINNELIIKKGELKKTDENEPEKINGGKKDGFNDGTDSDTCSNPTEGAKRSQKPRNDEIRGKKQTNVASNPPTLEEVQAYFEERRSQGKPFIYVTPESFYDACCASGWTLKNGKPIRDWQARCRTFETFRKEHGDQPVSTAGTVEKAAAVMKDGDPVKATTAKKYKKW